MRRLDAAVALLIVASLGAAAAPVRQEAIIDLDPANTTINFTLKGFPHTTTGSFRLKRGEIRVDPESGRAGGSIVVDANSGATGIGMRDSEMKDRILEARSYPEIVFTPRKVSGTPLARGVFVMTVSGTMTVHGAAHELTMEVSIDRRGDDFSAAARLNIPYVAWGMKNPSVLFLTVSDAVLVDVSSTGHVIWKIVR